MPRVHCGNRPRYAPAMPRNDSLALVACFRNENFYLREWLEYHRTIGVGHVYLYDNDGSAEARALVAPFVQQGFVTPHPWPAVPSWLHGRQQHQAFSHCARHYGSRHLWLMKIDIDEFLFASQDADVNAALARYDPEAVRCLRVPRYNFGACGHQMRPEGMVTASYLRREARYSNHKDIASTRHLGDNRFTQSSHCWRYRPLSYVKRCVREHEVQALRLHHYYTKSFEEYAVRQNPAGGRAQSREAFLERNTGCEAVGDDSLLRFVPAIEHALAQLDAREHPRRRRA